MSQLKLEIACVTCWFKHEILLFAKIKQMLSLFFNKYILMTLISVATLFYGTDLFLKDKKEKKKSILIITIGVFMAGSILFFSLIQYHSFSRLSSKNQYSDLDILRKEALSPKVAFRFRLGSARDIYISTGKKVEYLGKNNKVAQYQATEKDIVKRNKRSKYDRQLLLIFNNNIIVLKSIFIIYFSFIIFLICFIYKKLGEKKDHKTGLGN